MQVPGIIAAASGGRVWLQHEAASERAEPLPLLPWLHAYAAACLLVAGIRVVQNLAQEKLVEKRAQLEAVDALAPIARELNCTLAQVIDTCRLPLLRFVSCI